MSDEERRQEEERKRFERIRSLDIEEQETPTGRRRHFAGAQPLGDSLDPFSVAAPRPRTRSYGEIPADMYLSQQFRQSMNLGETQPGSAYGQQPPAPHRIQPLPSTGATSSSSRPAYGGAHRIQPAPSPHRIQPAPSPHRIQPLPSAHIIQRTGIPHFARQEPIREPQIVHRYRDPVTGEPSSDLLRQPTIRPPPWGGGPASSSEIGSHLANVSRDNISDIQSDSRQKLRRQKDILISRGFKRVSDKRIPDADPVHRFVPRDRPVRSQRPGFVPQTDRDMISTHDYRFNRPQREMDRPVYRPPEAKFGPVGRQQWGPLRRAYSLPDLSDPNLQADIDEPSRTALYMQNYVQLPSADRETYRHFRNQISYAENPNAVSRMVPPPTIGNMGNADKRRLKEMAHYRAKMMKYRIGEVSAETLRQKRRDLVRKKAYQQTALPTDTEEEMARAQWLAQGVQEGIEEEEEDEEEEE